LIFAFLFGIGFLRRDVVGNMTDAGLLRFYRFFGMGFLWFFVKFDRFWGVLKFLTSISYFSIKFMSFLEQNLEHPYPTQKIIINSINKKP
jgi:hypothetical protein